MTISDSQKVDYLWKKIGFSASKTDTAAIKDATNEAIPSPLQIRGDKIMANSAVIPSSIPASNTYPVTVFTTSFPLETVNDATASTNRTWKTNVTDWISPEFGSTYQVKAYISPSNQAANVPTRGTQIYATGSGNNDEWFFDYQSGVLNFIGTNLPSVSFTGNSVYISGAKYSGQFGYPNVQLGDFTFVGNTISSIQANGNIVLNAPGTGIVQIAGADALGLPVGDDSSRPTSPEIGYTRFSTSKQNLEYWNGTEWASPGEATISSQTIYPDGTSNVYTLGSNTSTDGVLVTINGAFQEPITAYVVINNNQIQFNETPLTTDTVAVRFIALGSGTSVGALRFGPTTAVNLDLANVIVTGNVIPSATNTYSIGSTDAGWKDAVITNHIVHSKANTSISSTSTAIIDTFDKTIYRSGKYVIQSSSSSVYECYEALVIHDSASNVYVTVYGVTNTGNALGNISANVVSNTVQLLYTAYSSNVYVKAAGQLLTL